MKNLLYPTLLATALSSSALAQTQDMPVSNNDGTGYIGAAVLLNSEYLGSADEEISALPYLSFNNVKGFTLFGTTLRYRAVDVGTGEGLGKWSLRAGPSVTYQGGRDSDESDNLNGFDDIGGSAPLGGFIRSTIGPIGLGVNVGKDIIGGHGGITADASIGTFLPLGNLKILPSATISWADDAHNDSFFSVTDGQAATSGLAAYDAGSGIYAYSAGIVSWVEIDERYAVSVIANYRWFTGDAADSPILNADDGSKNGVFAVLSVSRKFDTTKW
jgi:outer membrane scaffolding protein for murein synthesis (MipA/OmpV family)